MASLGPGSRLGSYEIAGALGAGGMGEVYRATDTRLDRTVAIKVLTSGAQVTPDLRERFEIEARAVAALNHPHICTLHDIGRERALAASPCPGTASETADPVDPGQPIDFLVMEFLDGETLAQRLERGALPIEDALRIAGEIAEGLDAAHRQGIVHRDLKPGNVMLTAAGVKLLDFGLAKLPEPGGPDAAVSAPTRAALTTDGTILGTLQYMSPEQLNGQPADVRSDIFSFGATVYEMVTGTRPFDGEGQASIIGSILKDEPPPIREHHRELPRTLDRLLRTCLAKDPDDRWQTVRDLKRELAWVAQPDETDDATVAAPAATGVAGLSRGRLGASLLATAAVTALAVWMLKPVPAPPAPAVHRFVIDVEQHQVLTGGVDVSPNGRRVVYGVAENGTTQLYLRSVDEFESIPIPGTEGAGGASFFFSPDSRHIGFELRDNGQWTLRRVPIAGGSPLTIGRGNGRLFGGLWLPDDTIVIGALRSGTGLMRVPAGGGEVEILTALDEEREDFAHIAPSRVPGRDEIFFTILPDVQDFATDEEVFDAARLAVYSPQSGAVSDLFDRAAFGTYIETGHWIYRSPGAAYAARTLDLNALAFGEPFPLLDFEFDFGSYLVDIVAGGTRAFIQQPLDSRLRTLAWVDRAGREEPLPLEPAVYRIARVSPDGRQITLDRGEPGARDVWVFDLTRETLSPLARTEDDEEHPVWTPDGRRIVFSSGPGNEANLHVRAADGSGPTERLSTSPNLQWPHSWSPDGRSLVISSRTVDPAEGVQPLDVRVMALDGDRAIAPLFVSEFTESNPVVSPDGNWIAYRSDESGRNEVYVQRFPELGGRVQISTNGGTAPLWSHDGTELYYRDGQALMAVAVQSGAQFTAGLPELLFEGQYLDDLARNYDLAPDGRFLMIKQAELQRIHVVINWIEELRASLAPD